jgi:sugar phosphate isomerase/epimerase
MKRAVGLAALTVIELPPPEQVSAAAAAGYTHVGLRLIPVSQQVLPAFEQRELEHRLADTGVKVLDVEVFRLDPGTDIAAFEPVLAIAARLHATDILVHGNDSEQARLLDAWGRLCDLARSYALAANLEPMPWVEVSTVAKAMAIVEAAARANGKLLVDAIHFFRADNSLAALRRIPAARLSYIQLCDAHPGIPADMNEMIRQARGDRLFPGEGALDLRGLLTAMPGDLPLSLEVPHARKIDAFERAQLALEATRRLLS